jgi:hypothetical protein
VCWPPKIGAPQAPARRQQGRFHATVELRAVVCKFPLSDSAWSRLSVSAPMPPEGRAPGFAPRALVRMGATEHTGAGEGVRPLDLVSALRRRDCQICHSVSKGTK